MRIPFIACSMAALALVSACGEATAPAGALTADEARTLALAIDDAGAAAVDSRATGASFALSPSGVSADVITHRSDFDVARECPVSGRAAVEGEMTVTIDAGAGTLEVGLDGTTEYTACRVRGKDGGEVEWTGRVDFDAERVARRTGTASGSQSHRGTVTYLTSTGKSGSCPIDVATEFTATPGAATRVVRGTVCGHSVDATTNWTRS